MGCFHFRGGFVPATFLYSEIITKKNIYLQKLKTLKNYLKIFSKIKKEFFYFCRIV